MDPEPSERIKQFVASWNEWASKNPGVQTDLEQVELIKQGSASWNEWREKNAGVQIKLIGAKLSDTDLRGADLQGADLRNADFQRADLRGANLRGADLSVANLCSADLRIFSPNDADLGAILGASSTELLAIDSSYAHRGRANLRGADLSGACLILAKLSGARVSGANLSGADLYYADLSDIKLSDVDLSDANLSCTTVTQTTFANVDLRKAKGLAEIRHTGPSIVQFHTVQLPQDDSALHFLQGTGAPDEYINLWRSVMMHPIQYHSIFISYSTKDETLARRLHADLQDHGVRCWFAPEDLKIGNKLRQRIDEAIHAQDKLLLLLSEHSIASSWVENEVEAALEKEERQQREVLFPIRLDDVVMQTSQAWAATLRRTRHIGDFTNWTDLQAYQQAFERLLRDLKKTS